MSKKFCRLKYVEIRPVNNFPQIWTSSTRIKTPTNTQVTYLWDGMDSRKKEEPLFSWHSTISFQRLLLPPELFANFQVLPLHASWGQWVYVRSECKFSFLKQTMLCLRVSKQYFLMNFRSASLASFGRFSFWSWMERHWMKSMKIILKYNKGTK